MTRTQRGIDRARERKQAKDPGHATRPGPSLLSSLEQSLLVHTGRYLAMKDIPFGDPVEQSHKAGVERGIVRGLAMAVARIRLPYEDQARVVRAVEREFTKKARQA